METKVNSTKIMLTNGILTGLITVVASVGIYITGKLMELSWIANLIWFLAMLAFIIMGLNTYKKENNGFLTLGNALKIGMGIAVITGVISSLYQVLFNLVIDPELVKTIMDKQIEMTINNNPKMTKEVIETTRKSIEFFSSPAVLIGAGIIWNCFIGFIISLISGLLMKKTEDSF